MGIIHIEGIRLHAHHGCLEEEGQIGGQYVVDVVLDIDFSAAEVSDELDDTADYVIIFNIVREEMAIRSKLIEHVGRRIADRLRSTFPTLEGGEVIVTKIRPPMNGDVDKVSVSIPL